jgi:hypothetical protein
MKKITLKFLLAIAFMCSTAANAQCLESIEGLYPTATSTAASCDGIEVTTITALAYASEYSNVEVTAGETYTFSSSLSTDYITISNDDGATASAFGTTPVTWVADVTGVVRFYTHTDDLCGGNQDFRTRSYVCGIPPCIQPIVTFSKTFDCGSSSFEVIADITDLGTATSMTITDDQGSASQSVSSAGPVTFGPYAFGTVVVLTVTNDQTPICNVVSDSQVILACPPANDECSGAVSLNVNPDASCTDFISGTITAATASSVSTTSCGGTEDDDVWFSFVATDAIQTISLNNVVGTTTDLFHSLWSGDCDTLTLVPGSCSDANASVPTGLTAGETYYLRVYSWTDFGQDVTFDVCIGTPPPPPANDECAGAIALNVNPDNNCTDVVSGTITSATGSLIDVDSCGGTEDDDVWFSFVATGSIQTISLNNVVGSTTDLYHSLWSGDCDTLSLVPNSCSDNNSSIPTGLTAGETYYLRVYSWTDFSGQDVTFDVCVGTPPPPPANDECANAVALNCGDTLTNQTTDSATGGTSTSCLGTIGNDVWYSFQGDGQVVTLTATGLVEFPQVEVYASTDGSCTGFTAGTCIASAGTGESVATASFVSENGTTYYIHVGTWINGDPALTFDLSITCETAAIPPANDDCDGSEALTVNPDASCSVVTSGSINGATASTVDATACGGSEDDDVWYNFIATDTIQAISLINTAGSTTDLFHSLWTGDDCSALTLVPGSCSDNDASVPSGLTAGVKYYIRVYTSTATALQNTTFDICVGTPPPPPTNDDCTGAIEITAGGTFDASPVVGSNVSSTTTGGLTFGCQTNRFNDVWYSVVVPDSGTLTVETAAAPGTLMTDSVISIFTGACGSLVEVGCNDDDGTDNFSKAVLTGLTPGETLYIGVWKWGTSVDGDFQLSAYDASLLSNDVFETSSFKSFPNPVKNILNLSYNKNISNVAVYNLLGQEVIAKAMNANQSQIDMSHLSNGTYLVKVTADNQVKTIKVIKE